ncbi:MAG: hypothetical protein AB8F95_13230 [Bacteroidia bacterium]
MRIAIGTILILSLFASVSAWKWQTSKTLSNIPVTPDMLYQLGTHNKVSALFDEQELGKRVRDFFPPYSPKSIFAGDFEGKELYLPIRVVINLKGTYLLHALSLFDTTGQGLLEIDYGNPQDWTTLCTDSLRSFGKWNVYRFDQNKSTQFIRITIHEPGAEIGELLLFGTKTKPSQTPGSDALQLEKRQFTFDAFCGINGFINDPMERLAPVAGVLREYHRWDWDEGNEDKSYPGYPDNQYAFSPSWARGEHWSWDFDDFYRKAKKHGLAVAPSLGGCAPFLRNHNPKRADDKPTLAGTDPETPEAYAALADYAYQFAARYGKTNVDPKHLKLSPEQKKRSGLDLIAYLEDGNEPDRWWQGKAAYHNPIEYAARLSAFYDGHAATLGKQAGAKMADPQLPVVMGGLARPDTNYLRAMLFWARYHRPKGDFPADVINLHHYSNTGGDQWTGDTTRGQSPEADDLYERLSELAAFRDRHLPGKELWLSELGYDTNPVSPQRAAARDSLSAQEMQARWIMRSMLIAQAAGIDRAFVYMLRDVSAESTVRYNSSGLTRELWHQHEPKTSWFYLATLKNALTDYYFDKRIGTEDKHLHCYRYIHKQSQEPTLVLWNDQEEKQEIDLNRLSLSAPDWLLTCEPGKRNGQLRKQPGATISVSGKPVLIGYGKAPLRQQQLRFGGVRGITVSDGLHPLVDEQSKTGNPAIGQGGAPASAWKIGWGADAETYTLSFERASRISDIWLYDGEGADSVYVSTSNKPEGPFRPIGSMKLDQYQKWRRIDGGDWPAQYIRLRLTGGAIGEVCVYGD